jgi:hypothetical protein
MITVPPAVYKWLAIGLVTAVLIACSVVLVIKAVNSVYDRGVKAGQAELRAEYGERLLQAQDKALKQQQEIFSKTNDLAALQRQYAELEATSPKEVIREVRKDPAFASARRPTDLHARRVRELQSLRSAAATH